MPALTCPACGHALDVDARPDRCPSCEYPTAVAYRYRLVAERGKLAGGVLYEAVDEGFGDKVAVIFIDDPGDASAVERFVEGNRLFAELGGHGLVKVHEVSSAHDPRPHVVMDWLAGGTLEQRVQRDGPLDFATLIEVVSDLLTGLGRAHRSIPPVVHGCIHPGTIGFRNGDDVVLFGFASARHSTERRQDIQQLGVAIHYAATGRWIGGLSARERLGRVRDEVQGPLATLIARMLDPDEGYASALEAQQDLERMLAGNADAAAKPESVGQPQLHAQAKLAVQHDQAKRNALRVSFAAIGVMMFGTCVAGILLSNSSPEPPPRPQVTNEPIEVPESRPPARPRPDKIVLGGDEKVEKHDPEQDVDCLLDPNLPKCKPPSAADEPTAEESLPKKLGATEIKAGIDEIKAAVKACGAKLDAPVGTAVSVKFELEGETGKPRSVSVTDDHAGTPLGDCVIEAASQATFSRFQAERQGFTYKFRM